MKRIPMHNRRKEIVAYALVDDEDFERVIAGGPWSLLGAKDSQRYARHSAHIDGCHTSTLLHRFVMGVSPGDPRVDHRDRNGLNCQKDNLRLATHAENCQNRSANGNKNNSSGYRNVTRDRASGKWRAIASRTENGRRRGRTLGVYDSPEEAASVAAAWRVQHMPFSDN